MTAPRRTGKTVPSSRKPTTPKAWKAAQATPVELPSGNYIRLRRMSMATLMATGKMPNALMGIVQSSIDKGQGLQGVEDQMMDLMGEEKNLREMARFMDELVTLVAIEPKVHPTPTSEEERSEDLLYADEVDENDKSFIFQLVTGGTSDLARFREATAANVAALSGRQDLELPSLDPAGTD